MKKIRWLPLICALLVFFSAETIAQQGEGFRPEKTLIKIYESKRSFGFLSLELSAKSGTAWCLDGECRSVVTNYHVAANIGPSLKIDGVKVIKPYLATGPQDEGAIVNQMIDKKFSAPLRYNPIRDIAIFRLERPLAEKGMRGVSFYPGEIKHGEEVRAYAYPGGGKLEEFPGEFLRELTNGVLEFRMRESADGKKIGPGVSGGLIVNRQNQAVGLAFAVEIEDGAILQAVPVWSLADFVNKVEPEERAKLFPGPMYRLGLPLPADAGAYAKLSFFSEDVDASAGGLSPSPALPEPYLEHELTEEVPPLIPRNQQGLHKRREEPDDIKMLRSSAQRMFDDMWNFIALQTLHFGGYREKEIVMRYEVRVPRVRGGKQTFRKWPYGKKESTKPSYPWADNWVSIGPEWQHVPEMLGWARGLRIEKIGEREIGGQELEIFRYEAVPEDRLCKLAMENNYIIFKRERVEDLACRGEVWTDREFRILRVTLELVPPAKETVWSQAREAVLYGWLKEPNEEPRLVPVSIIFQAQLGGRNYWCRGHFTNYRMFASGFRLLPDKAVGK